jgi:hypothetical protein
VPCWVVLSGGDSKGEVALEKVVVVLVVRDCQPLYRLRASRLLNPRLRSDDLCSWDYDAMLISCAFIFPFNIHLLFCGFSTAATGTAGTAGTGVVEGDEWLEGAFVGASPNFRLCFWCGWLKASPG